MSWALVRAIAAALLAVGLTAAVTRDAPIPGYAEAFETFCAQIHAAPDKPTLDDMASRIREMGATLGEIAADDRRSADQLRDKAESLARQTDQAFDELAYLRSQRGSLRRPESMAGLLETKLHDIGLKYDEGRGIAVKIASLKERLRQAQETLGGAARQNLPRYTILDPRYWVANPFRGSTGLTGRNANSPWNRLGNIGGTGGVDADGYTGAAIQQELDQYRQTEAQFVQAVVAATGRSFSPGVDGALGALDAEYRQLQAQMNQENILDNAEWARRLNLADTKYTDTNKLLVQARDDYVAASRAHRQSSAMAQLYENMSPSMETCLEERRVQLVDAVAANDGPPSSDTPDTPPTPPQQDTAPNPSTFRALRNQPGKFTISCKGGTPTMGSGAFAFSDTSMMMLIATPQGQQLKFGPYLIGPSGEFSGTSGSGVNKVIWTGRVSNWQAYAGGTGRITFFLDFGFVADALSAGTQSGSHDLLPCTIDWSL